MTECGAKVKTIENKWSPCLREKYHEGGCNPYSNTAPLAQQAKGNPATEDDVNKYLGKLVVGRTATGQVQFVGRVMAYVGKPTLQVRMLDGTQVPWVAEMCEVIQIAPEAVAKMFEGK